MSSLSVMLNGAASKAADRHVPTLVEEKFASRLFAKDHTMWGPAAEDESSKRLGWVDASEVSRPLVAQINELRESFAAEGVDRFVLAGMGGSSLAPEVITKTAGVELFVLDSTDPVMVQAALTKDIARTAAVISSKSGSTVETDSARRAFEKAFNDAGIDAARRLVVVTDPGSPFDQASRDAGYRAVFTADPTVGGRFSAMTAFGLVPSGLAGVDLEALLDEVDEAAEVLREDAEDNLGLLLGAVMGGTTPLRNKLLIQDCGSGIVGFADWAEQLIAESTGKDGTGILPVVVTDDVPELKAPVASDVLPAYLVPQDTETAPEGDAVAVAGSLGAQMLLWEVATAVAGKLLGINPFDQPDVESAKTATRAVLADKPEPTPAVLVDGSVEIRGAADLLDGAQNLTQAVVALLDRLPADGYVSIQAYFDRLTWTELEDARPLVATATGRPTTFGWGPRFLHSTGQFHKGGPGVGVFLQITADSETDLEIPGIPFTFGELISAQADGDAQVLEEHGRPVLRLRLTDRETGVSQLLDVLTALAQR
ncbi:MULTISPECIES: glucose-6-phosphate isomerase [Kocuria]|uniref:Glucose-6-phosphate isomerase n=1 Tax=Kocuria subflava TaxID=1736139 RepID=A0A846U521_9MICC|nr:MULTISPECIES: glucose-6-phosphate isomerase [Kocuria]NKE08816.1 glucose-6-phosphate isomerase [Kocuria subflava]